MNQNKYEDLGNISCTETTDNSGSHISYLRLDVNVFESLLSETPRECASSYRNMPHWQFRIEFLN